MLVIVALVSENWDNFGEFLTLLDLFIVFTIRLIQTLHDTSTSLSVNAIPWQPYGEIHSFPLENQGMKYASKVL